MVSIKQFIAKLQEKPLYVIKKDFNYLISIISKSLYLPALKEKDRGSGFIVKLYVLTFIFMVMPSLRLYSIPESR